ncbi:MAG: histidine--tRNA ligase [Elusimicrobiota bacterium]|nr:histidine--tRNA ligase [Elusimicrobiota bacterium]
MMYKAPRGTHDIFAKEAAALNFLEQKAKEIFRIRGFEEIITPIFEDAALFTRSIGQSTDIVEKEMYIFNDRKGRTLALRPEGTASLVRAFVEHSLQDSFPAKKFFYCGEMFRYERPQAGRYRQFRQIGAEFIGNALPCADAETIIVAHDILNSIGISSMKIHINSLGCDNCRPIFRESLVNYFSSQKDLCQDCLRRLNKNPLRLLDCKIDSSKFADVPKMECFLCSECKEHFVNLQSLLSSAKCNYTINSKLVRGLDYYNRTVFEIRSDAVGSQDAIAAGGRYDNLVKELGGSNTCAVGFALGCERVCLAAKNAGFFDNLISAEKIFIAVADGELFNKAFSFSIELGRSSLKNDNTLSVIGPIPAKNLTHQLKFADKIDADRVIIFAKNEFDEGKLLVKDMKNKTQRVVDVEHFF